MDWFKKHADTVIVLGGILSSIFWMNTKFSKVTDRFTAIEKDVAIIKTVLIMENKYPKELAKADVRDSK